MSKVFRRPSPSQRSAIWIVASLLCIFLVLALQGRLSLPSFSVPRLDTQVVAALVGAFAAAIGIDVVGKRKEKRDRDHDRQVLHYNSLVRLQWQINVIRATMEDNAAILKTIIDAIDEGAPTLQRPVSMAVDPANLMDLYDLKLINMLNDLYYDIRRLNLDTVNLNRVLDTLAEQKFAGTISDETYRAVGLTFRPQVVFFRQTLLYKLDHDVLDLAAYVRICVDRDASPEDQDRFKRIQKDRVPVTDKDIFLMRGTIHGELEAQEIEGQRVLAEIAAYDTAGPDASR